MARRLRRWVPTATFLAISVTCGVATIRVVRHPSPSDHRALESQVLSARRAHEALGSLTADRRLQSQLTQVFAELPGPASQRCLIVERGSRLLSEKNPEQRFTPASNQKVFTAAAVLKALPRQDRYRTVVRGDRLGSVVNGPLYLVGGGDPMLGTAERHEALGDPDRPRTPVESLVSQLIDAGLKEITGPVLGDGSRYDSVRYHPTWKDAYAQTGVVGPIGGLVVDSGFVALGPKPIPADDPGAHAAEVVRLALTAAGIVVRGGSGVALAPAVPELAAVESAPLELVVEHMLRDSDNTAAEMLLKELGLRVRGAGTTDAGVQVVKESGLTSNLGTASEAIDGSGLSRSNRATCRAVLDALSAEDVAGDLRDGFPLAGESGTLKDRFLRSAARGRVKAKTGALNGVASLSGFVVNPDHGLAFAFIANDLPDLQESGQQAQRRVAEALASHPNRPSADQLRPRRPRLS